VWFHRVGALVGTFLRAALLIAGQKALGRRFAGHWFFESVERDLALGIIRSHFHHGYPKGTHCCVQCTLVAYPVLEARAIRYFECASLADQVRQLVRKRQWRFAQPVNAAMADGYGLVPGRMNHFAVGKGDTDVFVYGIGPRLNNWVGAASAKMMVV